MVIRHTSEGRRWCRRLACYCLGRATRPWGTCRLRRQWRWRQPSGWATHGSHSDEPVDTPRHDACTNTTTACSYYTPLPRRAFADELCEVPWRLHQHHQGERQSESLDKNQDLESEVEELLRIKLNSVEIIASLREQAKTELKQQVLCFFIY